MPILMPLYKKWSDMILNKEKPFEFRSKIGRNFYAGDTIYLYESSKNNGCQKIVGEVRIKNISKIEHTGCDTAIFIEYYLKNILKNDYYVKQWQSVKRLQLDGYNDYIKLSNIFCIDFLKALKNNNTRNFVYDREFLKRKKLSEEVANAADEWLYKIGYYNSYGQTTYDYALELYDIKRYNQPLELENFENNKGEIITQAPQSWCYCKKRC